MEPAVPAEIPAREPGLSSRSLMFFVVMIPVFWVGFVARTAYLDKRIRPQGSVGAELADGSKAAVADYFARNHAFPSDNRQAGLPEPTAIHGKYVSSVAVADGTITVTFGNKADARIDGQKLGFSPHAEAGSIQWSCNSAAGTTVENKLRPSPCRQ